MDTAPILVNFEGFDDTHLDTHQIPNLLLMRYADLGLSDGQAALLLHIVARKPGRSLVDFPMSANMDTRRRYVRDLRQQGLIFTARLFQTESDSAPGKTGSNLWYLGSLFHNLVRIHCWLNEDNPLETFQIEIPIKTVNMFLKGKFHDTAPNIAQAIRDQTRNGINLKSVMLPLSLTAVEKIGRQKESAARSERAKRRRYEFEKRRALLRLLLINRDGYICAECGATSGLTIDHKIPISKGGSDELENLQFLCLSCNSKKGNRIEIAESQVERL